MTHALSLFKLDGKVALVTGGGRGLGYHMAEGLAEAGADVAICGRNPETLEAARKKLAAIGSNALALPCDVAKEADVVALAARMKEHYGRCDILINNAGVSALGPSEQMATESWQQLMDINLGGTFLCCREIGKQMIAQKSGSIINVSSENGQVGFSMGMSAYATTKIGQVGLTRSLAVEWGQHGIRVNALLPGNTEEGMTEFFKDREGPLYQGFGAPLVKLVPSGRLGTGDDFKGAAVFLASDASAYVNGAMLVVDGGFTINAGV
ncbi:MAG: SDR family oxidoreductase [Myxococcales bacterium]|nr:SDR family oxidoreductase [Myxococcales bacterium]